MFVCRLKDCCVVLLSFVWGRTQRVIDGIESKKRGRGLGRGSGLVN